MKSVDDLLIILDQGSDIMHMSMGSQQRIHGASSLGVGELWACTQRLCDEGDNAVMKDGTEGRAHRMRETDGT